ncbi:FAD-binding protein [Pseudotabrizicola algicola]|uniref:FAD-binding protein n=1 Tax=Pseudotabrizicola algicola TaxID=2709381 RepID=A0A6B3RNJ3_9RHOB|nr:FAD-binding protein [Pseudotabrizicola algicola]NEX47011.1 FAD-binding protein [Pseudotabrizicola algicola]
MQPSSEAELAEIIRAAKGPLCVKGGGTRSLGTCAGEVLETSGLSGVVLYEPGALTLVAGAGTPVAEVEALLAAEGQRLPFEVPDLRGLLGRTGESTLGGVVAANASGPRRVQVGACRDSLIGVRFVDGAGTIIKNGGRVMKNVTGYDLVKLLAGSWGTLGVLSEVSFKLLPVPEAGATLILPGLSDRQAVQAMAAALGSPFEVNGAAHWPGQGTYLRIEGFAASVAYRAEALRRHLAAFGAVEVEDGTDRWAAIRDVAPFQGRAGDVWRLSVKPSDAPEIVARMEVEAVLYDWGGGLIWALCVEGDDLRARLGAFQGHATRVRGAGPGAFHPEAPGVAALTHGLRAKFDPRGLLNPGLMDA